jgi:hypothetical protein
VSISAIWRKPRESFFGVGVLAILVFSTFSVIPVHHVESQTPAESRVPVDEMHGPLVAEVLTPNSRAEVNSISDGLEAKVAAEEVSAVALAEVVSSDTLAEMVSGETLADAISADTPAELVSEEILAEVVSGDTVPEVVSGSALAEVVSGATPAEVVLADAPAALPLAWGAKVSPAFRDEVRAICGRLKCDPNHLMAAMAFESVETFSPSVRNPRSGATGLIQFMEDTARVLGTSQDELAAMTAEEQLVFVERYLKQYAGKLTTLADIYMAILWPRAVGQPDDHVLFSNGSIQYAQNVNLDDDGDGVITKMETASLVTAKLAKGLRPQYLS